MEQITKEAPLNKKTVKVAMNKKAAKSTNKAYKAALFAIVGTLFWQSASTFITHYRISSELEELKRDQAIKVAEIEAARTQLQGVASKLAYLSKAGNQNAEAVVERFRTVGVDIRLDDRG